MMCLQRLRHSLACTAQRKQLGEKRQRVVQKAKGKRIPWRTEHVQCATPTIVQIDSAPSAMTPVMPSWIAPLPRTPVAVSSSTMEIQRGCSFVPEVQVFKGGIVTVQGPDLIFSVIHLSPLVSDSPFTFTVPTTFLTDVYQYAIW